MNEQITMYDLKPKKFKTPMWPEYDDCYTTCGHFLPLDCYLNSRKKEMQLQKGGDFGKTVHINADR